MIFYNAMVLAATINVGDKFYIKQNGKYLTFDSDLNGKYGSKNDSPLFTAKRHDLGGLTFETDSKALNYSSKYNQGGLYYKGTNKANNNWIVESEGKYVKLKANANKKCATTDNNKMMFLQCVANKAEQQIEIEKINDTNTTKSNNTNTNINNNTNSKTKISSVINLNNHNINSNLDDIDGNYQTTKNKPVPTNKPLLDREKTGQFHVAPKVDDLNNAQEDNTKKTRMSGSDKADKTMNVANDAHNAKKGFSG
ncbi:hypothetical protein EHP00_1157 [Ecytonucleospora hepatopenaei]|uniref:Uncharacterized protein n=1 Tax=Ecytonucleospora hepatopenaei TaxID=646526 RepID=A0A1W0E4A0_9MICR|nr:hypothetical protein EHP00_1157 [Ecytonucleospora hepatopenaei]